ncbi:MAG: HindIII family type II restriction endonuclease [Nitrosomonas sp.]
MATTIRTPVITADAIASRRFWIDEIKRLSGDFGADSDRVEAMLRQEIADQGHGSLLDHLRLCGDIPEAYSHDSSEEKLYSKYTDALLSRTFTSLGLRSLVLRERGDAADVEAFAPDYSFVADAKAFRLSRTAKNQKDFKIQAMDGWKRGKPYAMVVCPIYQLPTRSSQIYEQASGRNVCIFTYSHLAVLSTFAATTTPARTASLLRVIFDAVRTLNPSKDASPYWLAVNRAMLGFDQSIAPLWDTEKVASVESLAIAKALALEFLATEREAIMRLSHDAALAELLRINNIESRIRTIRAVANSGLMEVI